MTAPSRRVWAPNPRACGLTDRGPDRPCNQDALYVAPDGGLLVVADGMGGHRAGEVASDLAVARLVECLSAPVGPPVGPGGAGALQHLELALQQAHEAVAAAGRQEGWEGMGAVVVAACVAGDELRIGHVGDARGYRYRAGRLVPLTHDHSRVAEWVRQGRLTPDEARCHPARNQVSQALGASERIAPDLHRSRLVPGDVVLLCSDGLWSALADEEIGPILGRSGSLLERATALLDQAAQGGGPDDVTAVAYEHAGGRAL